MPFYRFYYWSPKRRCLLTHDIAADNDPDDAFLKRLANAGRNALRLSGTCRPATAATAPPRIAEVREHIDQARRLLDEIGEQLASARGKRGRLHLRYPG